MNKQIRGVVKELETVVKRKSSKEKSGHITLPFSMRDKRVLIECLDGSGFLYTWARKSGNSSHALVTGAWIGKKVNVKVLVDKAEAQ